MIGKHDFQQFGTIMQSELLDEQQMNSLQAGGKCEIGCKKSCYAGNQNGKAKDKGIDVSRMPVCYEDDLITV